jgi:hypothetical protein
MRPALTIAAILLLSTITTCGGGSGTPASNSAGSPEAGISIILPVADGQSAYNAYGIWPFGIHGGGHAADGHPGIDIEYTLGSQVLAAADGTIQSVTDDTQTPGRYTIQILHGARYRTDYTNVTSLAQGIAPNASVTAGQPLGAAGEQTLWMGSHQATFAMTHFQLDDFNHNEGLSNPFAVEPVSHFNAEARAIFDRIWAKAAYRQEFCEPFFANERGTVANPTVTRSWNRAAGGLAPVMVFTCPSGGTTVSYILQDETGAVTEEGTAELTPTAGDGSSPISLLITGGGTRRGVYTITGGSMTIDYGAVGAGGPSNLSNGSTYTTS